MLAVSKGARMAMQGLRTLVILGGLLGAISLPTCAQTPAESATQLAGDGRYADAVPKFVEAIRLEPKNASLRLGLGLAYQALQKYPEAVQALEAAVKLGPNSPEPHYSLALLYEAAAADPVILKENKTPVVQRRFWQKARQAWEKVVLSSKDPKRLATAKEHLESMP